MAKVTLSLPDALWADFQRACKQHQVVPSWLVAAFMDNMLGLWNMAPHDDHAPHAAAPVFPSTPNKETTP
jgi:hypothetical protein